MAPRARDRSTSKQTKKVTKKGTAATIRQEVGQVSSAARRRAEDLIALIERRKVTITESFYEIGQALKELHDKKLHAALGYPSFQSMLRARGVFGTTQANKLIQIVSSVPLRTALQLGPEKAFALIRYAAATPELDTPQTLLDSDVKIGKTTATKASVREIADAAQRSRAKAPGRKVDPAVHDAERAAKHCRAWLAARGIKDGDVISRRTKQGYRLQIEIPVAAAARLFGKR